ncbi:MAG: DsrE family protein [Hellea sp.]|nr:DsrE family protein [Hellea sp.]
MGCLAISVSSLAHAGEKDFKTGPVILKYGKAAMVELDEPLPKRSRFKVSFDTAEAGQTGEVNRKFDSLARFLNMHAQAGTLPNRIDLAMVVHGPAATDLTNNDYYGAKYDGAENANAPLIRALMENGTEFYICGQTAAYRDINQEDLLPEVKMSLSAMTAHAQLQQDGYTLNPF